MDSVLRGVLYPDDLLHGSLPDTIQGILYPDDFVKFPRLGHFPGVTVSSPPLGWSALGPVFTSPEFVRGVGSARSLYFVLTFGAEIGRAWTTAAIPVQLGQQYWIGGYYYARARWASTARARVTFYGAEYLMADGRSVGPESQAGTFPLVLGEWRRFAFRFVSPYSSGRVLIMVGGTVGESVEVWFDQVALRRVWGDRFHAPRISAGDVPAAEMGKNDIIFGGSRLSSGALGILAADGVFDGLSSRVDIAGGEIRIKAGGRDKAGAQVPPDALKDVFVGDVQSSSGEDVKLRLEATDARISFHVRLPRREYSRESLPNMDPRFDGKPRPYRFGLRPNVTPIGIDKVGDYRKYELVDCSDSVAGILGVDAVYSYLTAEAATAKDATRRVLLTSGVDYVVDPALGSLTILRDVHVREIVAGKNDRLDFDVGGGALVGMLTPGVYAIHDLAAHYQAVIRTAIGGGDTTGLCTYSDTTHLASAGRTSGTMNVRLSSSAANKDRSGWREIGFTTSADKTGASAYAADSVVFKAVDVDRMHILRADVRGFKDDVTGTYTGTPSALIELGPDLAKLLFVRHLRRALDDVDVQSTVAARAAMPEKLAFDLDAGVGSDAVFDTLELTNYADCIIGEDGKLYYVSRADTTLPEIQLRDADFVSYESHRALTDVFDRVVLEYSRDPSTDEVKTFEAPVAGAASRYRRIASRSFATYHTDRNAAGLLALRFAALVVPARLVINAMVKGQLIRARMGQRVRVTRARDVVAGSLSAALFRVRSLRQDTLRATTDAVLVESLE